MNRALFIFRRDLRLEDNTGLLYTLENAQEVILSFIFTAEQIEHNPYRSDHCLQFMIESLEDLEKEIKAKGGKLYIFFGEPENIIAKCIEKLQIDLVVVNQDYTPYSIQRDQKIQTMCEKLKVAFHSFDDLLLHPIDETFKSDGTPYTVFTPYYRNAYRLEVEKPAPNHFRNYYSGPLSFAENCSLYKKILPRRFDQQKGGRTAGLHILRKISDFTSYPSLRNDPAKNQGDFMKNILHLLLAANTHYPSLPFAA